MPRCVAIGCNNNGNHSFPKDLRIRKLWERATKIPNFQALGNSKLCSKHFKETDFQGISSTTGLPQVHRYLKKSAVPSVFAWSKPTSSVASAREQRYMERSRTHKMIRCCVPRCHGLASHRFPRNVEMRKLWLEAIGLESLIPTESTRVCRGHFTDKDYIDLVKGKGKGKYRNLVKTAVPSIFPWTKSKAEPEEQTTFRSRTTSKDKVNSTTSIKKCCVDQCTSRTTDGITYYSFPKNESLKNRWAQILNIGKDSTRKMKVCSIHFSETDFVSREYCAEKLLKRNALPSQNLSHPLLVIKEELDMKPSSKKLTIRTISKMSNAMTGARDENVSLLPDELLKCRACLTKREKENGFCVIFEAWSPPWLGMGTTIAEDLSRIANIEISESDTHSNLICPECYQSLLDAAKFVSKVRYCDSILKQSPATSVGITTKDDVHEWPKPIQVDKNINSLGFDNSMEVDIKQEVLSEDEYGNENTMCTESVLDNMEIKVEPEDIVASPINVPPLEDIPQEDKVVPQENIDPPMDIKINGTMSLDPSGADYPEINGTVHDEAHLDVTVKDEPLSDEEDVDPVLDLPLDCMLCAKPFNSVSGLKAHVIAQHSYKTVKRKTGSEHSLETNNKRHVCEFCRRSFSTPTDLMVHETCHNMFSCYGCFKKFDTFELLKKHRSRCKATLYSDVPKIKTLDDVMRPKLNNSKENSPIPEIVSIGPANLDAFQDKVDTPTEEDMVDRVTELEVNQDTVESIASVEASQDTVDKPAKLEVDQDTVDSPDNIKFPDIEDNRSVNIKVFQEAVDRTSTENIQVNQDMIKSDDDDMCVDINLVNSVSEKTEPLEFSDIDMNVETV